MAFSVAYLEQQKMQTFVLISFLCLKQIPTAVNYSWSLAGRDKHILPKLTFTLAYAQQHQGNDNSFDKTN